MKEEATNTTNPAMKRKGKLKCYVNGKPQYELFKQLMLHNSDGKTVGPFDFDGEVVLTNGASEEASAILMILSDSVPATMLPAVVKKEEAEPDQARNGVTFYIPGESVRTFQLILMALTCIVIGMYVEAIRAWFVSPSPKEIQPARYYATR